MNKEDAIKMAIDGWKKIKQGAEILNHAYDEYPELNDIQPNGTKQCLPMSIDEWVCELTVYIEDWKELIQEK